MRTRILGWILAVSLIVGIPVVLLLIPTCILIIGYGWAFHDGKWGGPQALTLATIAWVIGWLMNRLSDAYEKSKNSK